MALLDQYMTGINVGLGILNAGAALMNVYLLWSPRRVRLIVTPFIPQGLVALAEDPDTYQIRVQVTNLSAFPVYLNEIGLEYCDPTQARMKFPSLAGRPYPIVLNPRESIRALPADDMLVVTHCFRRAYARTACGRFRYGTSPTLLQQEINVREHNTAGNGLTRSLRYRFRLHMAWLAMKDRLWAAFHLGG